MNPLLLPAAIDLGSRIIDRIWPDKQAQEAERAKAELALLEMARQGELAQIEVNKTEAAHASTFVAGWRPGAGWTCVAGLAYTFLAQPLLAWASAIYDVPAPPAIDVEVLLVLLGGMLGLGGLRTHERVRGVIPPGR